MRSYSSRKTNDRTVSTVETRWRDRCSNVAPDGTAKPMMELFSYLRATRYCNFDKEKGALSAENAPCSRLICTEPILLLNASVVAGSSS